MNPDLIAALIRAGLIDADIAAILQRQADPDAARAWAEEQLATAVGGGLSDQQQALLDLVERSGFDPSAEELTAFWRGQDAALLSAMRPVLRQVATERAALAAAVSGQMDAFELINQVVLDWVDSYYIDPDGAVYGSVPNLNLTSRTRFAAVFRDWQRGELGGRADGLPQLINALTPTFGPDRAEAIAVTETTRVFVQAGRLAEANNPATAGFRWLTSADEQVCSVCGPHHGEVRRKNEGYGGGADIPAHPRCRCDETPETAATLRLPVAREERFVFSGEG